MLFPLCEALPDTHTDTHNYINRLYNYRDKDKALVEFESELREREKERELLEEKLTRQDQDVSSYLQLIDVKDQSIVKLTNQLDELELAVKIDKAASPPIVGNTIIKNILCLSVVRIIN